MGFSLLLIPNEERVSWKEVNAIFSRSCKYIEGFPVQFDSKDCLGLNIPSKSYGLRAWGELKPFLSVMVQKFDFKIWELYNGSEVTQENIADLKKYIMGGS